MRAIEAKLPNPAVGLDFNPKDIDHHPVYGDMYGHQGESQFIRDKRIEDRNQANQHLPHSYERDLDDGTGSFQHEYTQIEKNTIEDLITSGQVNRDELMLAKSQVLSNRQVSLGYAFVTFSHADEAK